MLRKPNERGRMVEQKDQTTQMHGMNNEGENQLGKQSVRRADS